MGLKKKFMLANWGIAEAGEDVVVADGMEEDKTEKYSYFNMLKNSCYVSIVAWFIADITMSKRLPGSFQNQYSKFYVEICMSCNGWGCQKTR
jgi:hypothetical protein